MNDMQRKAYKDYQAGMKYTDIASKYGVTINTVKSWKTRHSWQRGQGAPVQESVHTKKRAGAPKGNKNAVGNRGGAPPPIGNKRAEKHGFFSKYMPPDTLEIMQQLETQSAIDIVWENITIQYTAIIRAQQIMYVKAPKEVPVTNDTEAEIKANLAAQQAFFNQSSFLQAQSRAMDTLQKLIKQYDALLRTELATEEQKARIEVLRAKVPSKDDYQTQDDGFIEALKGQLKEIWDDGEEVET